MQPTESFGVQRRALDVEDYIDILRRHKGWIFGPFLLTLVGSVVGAYLYPDSYESSAIVQIRRQQVSEAMVAPIGTQDIVDRINVLLNQVESRNELTTLVTTLNLYPKERAGQPMDAVLAKMKNDIVLSPIGAVAGGRGVPAFQVKFKYPNRFDARKLVENLVSRFIDEDSRTGDSRSYQTRAFMKDLVDQSEKKLKDIEDQITEFRNKNQGRLPDEVNSNLTALNSAQSQVTFLSSAASRASGEKLQLEAAVRTYQDQIATLNRESQSTPVVKIPKTAKLQSAENQLENLQTSLNVALKTYTDGHPDVRRLRQQISVAEQVRDQAAAEDAAMRKDEPAAPVNFAGEREVQKIQGQINQLQASIAVKAKEIADYEKQMKTVTDQISLISSRLGALPAGDQVYGDLLRQRALANDEYIKQSENLRKAEVAVDLQGRSQGEKLELLDPATLPEMPTEPNRPMVISMGAGVGLILGVVLAGAREMKDTSLKNLKDVRAYTQIAILGSVPLLENDFVVRRRRRIAWLAWTVACLGAMIVMAGAVVYYYYTKP